MKLKDVFLSAVLLIPINGGQGWMNLKLSQVPANRAEFSREGLEIKVDHSSSPLIFPLEKVTKISGFTIEIEIVGDLKVQGKAWPEDQYLRMGFVIPGERHLGVLDGLFAGDWVKELFKLSPPGMGIDRVVFYDLTANPSYLGRSRTIPKSKDLMEEFIAADRKTAGKTFSYKLPQSLSTSALWISANGENTGSAFTVKIKKLTLDLED